MELKQYLKNKDREAFAVKIGTTRNYIAMLCCNQRRPSPDLALKIEQATGGAVTIMELLFPNQDHQPKPKDAA